MRKGHDRNTYTINVVQLSNDQSKYYAVYAKKETIDNKIMRLSEDTAYEGVDTKQ